jgi:subtilisin
LNNNIGVVGVAPEAKLIAVKVLNSSGSGSWSSVICGIDWVTANKAAFNIKVANMSLGGWGDTDNNCGFSNNDPLHQAICRSTQAGITYVVAAGNDGDPATDYTPGGYDDTVITVSALVDTDGKPGGLGPKTTKGKDDTFASFSNYGSVVDLAAPGVNINSTWKSKGYKTISGTSMSTPHVTGAAALYLKNNPGANWTEVKNALISSGEVINNGHTDPSGKHPEAVLKINSF